MWEEKMFKVFCFKIKYFSNDICIVFRYKSAVAVSDILFIYLFHVCFENHEMW